MEPLTQTPEYKRLPCRSFNRSGLGGGICTLWQGDDHFLHVTNTRFLENYRRFFFKEIKSITVRKNKTWIIAPIICLLLGLLTLASGIHFARLENDNTIIWIAAIMGGPLILATIYLFLRGPSCVCEVRTEVQTEKVGAIKTMRQARRVLPIMQKVIEATQGKLQVGEDGLEPDEEIE